MRKVKEMGARQIRENQNPPNSRNKNQQIEEPLSESSRNKNGKVCVIVEKIGTHAQTQTNTITLTRTLTHTQTHIYTYLETRTHTE